MKVTSGALEAALPLLTRELERNPSPELAELVSTFALVLMRRGDGKHLPTRNQPAAKERAPDGRPLVTA